jgi:transcriptional regulator with XRE-family HTH domain
VPTLRELREAAILTQIELAHQCGVSKQTIWEWENGKARPRPSHIRQLATVLGKSPAEVLDAVKTTMTGSGSGEKTARRLEVLFL